MGIFLKLATVMLLISSLSVNALQYVGSAALNGLYEIVENVTSVPSKKATQMRNNQSKVKDFTAKARNKIAKITARMPVELAADALPVAGAAVTLGVIAWDLYDLCEMNSDMAELEAMFSFEGEAAQTSVCGIELAKQEAKKMLSEDKIEESIEVVRNEEPGAWEKTKNWGRSVSDSYRQWSLDAKTRWEELFK